MKSLLQRTSMLVRTLGEVWKQATAPMQINGCAIPASWTKIEQDTLRLLTVPSDDAQTLMARYLVQINAVDRAEEAPDHMANGVAMKLMYEHVRKFKNLEYGPSNNDMRVADALRRLENDERSAFSNFCIKHSTGYTGTA